MAPFLLVTKSSPPSGGAHKKGGKGGKKKGKRRKEEEKREESKEGIKERWGFPMGGKKTITAVSSERLTIAIIYPDVADLGLSLLPFFETGPEGPELED